MCSFSLVVIVVVVVIIDDDDDDVGHCGYQQHVSDSFVVWLIFWNYLFEYVSENYDILLVWSVKRTCFHIMILMFEEFNKLPT